MTLTEPGVLYAMPRNLVLAASAGTGKTHALVGVVVHLLMGAREGGVVEPTRIVATTFSRKAAAEIRARVVSEMERLAEAPSTSVYADGLRAMLNRESASGLDGGIARTMTSGEVSARAKKALAVLPRARFGTLHSFATGIVQRYAVELGLGPGFDLANEADSRARSEDAIAHALEKRLENKADLERLRSLTEAAGGIDRLVGSLRRALLQLEEDGRSARELSIDSRDAAEIEGQMRELLLHARAVSSFPKCEHFARALAKAWDAGDEAAIEEAAAGLTSIPARGKLPTEVESFFAFRKELLGTTNEEKGRRLARTWRSRNYFTDNARLVRDLMAEAELEIERTGRARAALGFGEVLRAARELLRDRPDVADEVGAGIDALLVDEFQDTSRVQRDLLQLLWAKPQARPRAGLIPPMSTMRDKGLLVVGDRKQSIYGFRGADVGVFAELAVGLAGAPAREALGIPAGVTWEPQHPIADFHALRHNRRSVASILGFANAFSSIRFQPGDPPTELFEIDYVPVTEDLLVPPSPSDPEPKSSTDPDAGMLRVFDPSDPERSLPPSIRNSRPSTRPSSSPTEIDPVATKWLRIKPKGSSSTRIEEALVIAARIREMTHATTTDPNEPVALRDLAVLATTNGMLDAVAFALAQANIPYVVAGKSFFRAREISDLAAMLSLVLEPQDRLAMLEVLRGPWASVHDETLLALVDPMRGIVPPNSWTTPPHPALVHPEDRAALETISNLVLALGRCAGRLGAGAILREAVQACGFEAVLAAMPRGQQRVANVQKLLAMADRHPDARAFRRWLDEAKEQEVSESEAATFSDEDDAVRLLTVHASKGLDFPIVFLPEIGAGLPRTDRGVAKIMLGAGDAPNILSVRISDDTGLLLEPPSYVAAHTNAKRRERAERQRLSYVAVTRAAKQMFLVGGRSSEREIEAGSSTLAALELLSADSRLLAVEDVEVPALVPPAGLAPSTDLASHDAPLRQAALVPPEPPPPNAVPLRRSIPAWRSLPIAPTALRDFAHCARRFELIHVLGLPEYARTGLDASDVMPAMELLRDPSRLDARARGTIAHAVLERLPLEAFLAGPDGAQDVERVLSNVGVPADHPDHKSIAARAMRFLRTRYVQDLAAAATDAKIMREVPFVLSIGDSADNTEDGHAVTLRGNMDLVVAWPDGSVDVIDYKTARAPLSPSDDEANADEARAAATATATDTTSYSLQLDVYALAARARFPEATTVRAGLSFLGSGSGEPAWRELPTEADVRARIASLGKDLVLARWTYAFPRVAIERCESIHCGFIGRCHPNRAIESASDSDVEEKDDEAFLYQLEERREPDDVIAFPDEFT